MNYLENNLSGGVLMRALDDIQKMYKCIIVIISLWLSTALFIFLAFVHSLHAYGVNTVHVFESYGDNAIWGDAGGIFVIRDLL